MQQHHEYDDVDEGAECELLFHRHFAFWRAAELQRAGDMLCVISKRDRGASQGCEAGQEITAFTLKIDAFQSIYKSFNDREYRVDKQIHVA